MKGSKLFSGLAEFGVAYCIGNCSFVGLSSFGIAFLSAGIMNGRSLIPIIAGVYFGMLSGRPLEILDICRYAIIGMLIVVLLKNRNTQLLYPRTFLLSFITGMLTIAVNVGCILYAPDSIYVSYALLEGVFVFSLTFVYSFSLSALMEDLYGFLDDTQGLLAVLILTISVAAGIPIRVFSEIEVAQSVCLFFIFLVWYKFGFGAGMSFSAIVGTVYALRTQQLQMLPAWVFVTLISACLGDFFHMGRYGSVIVFALAYFLLGYFKFDELVSEAGIKAIGTAVFLLLLMPSVVLYQTAGKRRLADVSGAEWGRLTIMRLQSLANALKRIDYTFAVAGNTGIGFGQVGTMLEDFSHILEDRVPIRRVTETAILEQLGKMGIQVKSLALVKSKKGIYRMYLDARVGRGRFVGAEAIRQIICRETGIEFSIGEESRQMIGRDYNLIILEQTPCFALQSAVRRLSCQNEVESGDNFYIGKVGSGQALVMLADGMGSGSLAAADSEELLASLQELLSSGLDEEVSVRLVNAYLADKNKGEHFATLDLLFLDLHTGYGHVMKHGAATTYIRRADWMECIKSTSLPVGVCNDADCECSRVKYYAGDLIVMVSDGVLDSILFENKDDYMNGLLREMESDEPEDVVELIVSEVRKVCGNRLKDDATVIVSKVVKNL